MRSYINFHRQDTEVKTSLYSIDFKYTCSLQYSL